MRGTLHAVRSREIWRIPYWLLTRRSHFGYCPICQSSSLFAKYRDWLRDHYRCVRCWSIPRERALVKTTQEQFPTLSSLRVYESSPGTVSSNWIAKNSGEYVASHFYPDVQPGKFKGNFRCENLERMTFGDCEFDLVITQDVMEHVLDPASAFREIARILRPGGAHVFTVPIYSRRRTRVRAKYGASGVVEYLTEPEFHGNPIDKSGALVVTEWGDDLPEFIEKNSRLRTERYHFDDAHFGLRAEFLDVLVSRKEGLSA